VRLVDTTLENQQYLTGIARMRGCYKSLAPEAARYPRSDSARWPEAPVPLMALFISYQGKRFQELQKMIEAAKNEGLAASQ
jgi:hypothetical protein